jgi:hypothetical protein
LTPPPKRVTSRCGSCVGPPRGCSCTIAGGTSFGVHACRAIAAGDDAAALDQGGSPGRGGSPHACDRPPPAPGFGGITALGLRAGDGRSFGRLRQPSGRPERRPEPSRRCPEYRQDLPTPDRDCPEHCQNGNKPDKEPLEWTEGSVRSADAASGARSGAGRGRPPSNAPCRTGR